MATKKSLPQDPSYDGTKQKKKKLPPGVVERVIKDENGNTIGTRWYVRVRYREGNKRHAAWRECAKNPTAARDVRKQLKHELERHGTRSLKHAQKRWRDLAGHYETNELIPARYVDGIKVAGRRSVDNPKSQLRHLNDLIGDTTLLRAIDYAFCKRIRLTLFELPKRAGGQRSMVDVNRHMQLFRAMMKTARNELSWVTHDPFADAPEPLVTPDDEKKRTRVMSFDEEDALLRECIGRRAHLRVVIIGLVDSLMRETEFFQLRVSDVDAVIRRMNVRQMTTKTLRDRAVPLSSRFATEVRTWIGKKKLQNDELLFDFASVKRSFATARKNAGISNLRIKDFRRTGATRLLRAGLPIAEISRILGHQTIEMTYEYIGVDLDTTSRAVDLTDAMHSRRDQLELIN